MVAFNFMPCFASDVERGRKINTMRRGKQRCKVGQEIQLYTGQRTRKCRKLGRGICIKAVKARVFENEVYLEKYGVLFAIGHKNKFARSEGFKTWKDLIAFFTPNPRKEWKGFYYRWALYD